MTKTACGWKSEMRQTTNPYNYLIFFCTICLMYIAIWSLLVCKILQKNKHYRWNFQIISVRWDFHFHSRFPYFHFPLCLYSMRSWYIFFRIRRGWGVVASMKVKLRTKWKVNNIGEVIFSVSVILRVESWRTDVGQIWLQSYDFCHCVHLRMDSFHSKRKDFENEKPAHETTKPPKNSREEEIFATSTHSKTQKKIQNNVSYGWCQKNTWTWEVRRTFVKSRSPVNALRRLRA